VLALQDTDVGQEVCVEIVVVMDRRVEVEDEVTSFDVVREEDDEVTVLEVVLVEILELRDAVEELLEEVVTKTVDLEDVRVEVAEDAPDRVDVLLKIEEGLLVAEEVEVIELVLLDTFPKIAIWLKGPKPGTEPRLT
jgi:hypothetical protein